MLLLPFRLARLNSLSGKAAMTEINFGLRVKSGSFLRSIVCAVIKHDWEDVEGHPDLQVCHRCGAAWLSFFKAKTK